MLDNDKKALIALSGKKEICILPAMANRHGLICGATGTGKSVSLQTMAETFSSLGVPVFLADVKGDLSGMAMPGKSTGKLADRVRELDLEAKGYKRRGFPVCFWDVFGKEGHPLRTTISELGPLLLSRLLGLNDVQSGVLQIVFRIADDSGLLLLDLKDLRSMLAHVGEERDQYKNQYGQISPASVGAIQRALLGLEEEGGDRFFGEPALDVENLLKCDKDGLGIINILSADALINAPQLYSCVLLWLLSDLFEHLPEVGDCPKPRLVFFFDEAHLLFDGITPVLLQKIEQVARLIRSRGVGIFFVTQNPSDVPDSVLGQLGNRVEHAMRAFTPKEQKAVRAAASAFRPNPDFSTEKAIGELGVGEALVSFLDANGTPQIVERALVLPPEGQVGPTSEEQRAAVLAASPFAGIYDKVVDRESAYEILAGRAYMKQAEAALAQRKAEMAKEEKARQKAEMERQKEEARASKDDGMTGIVNTILRQTTRSMTNTVGREIGKTILRGVLGGLLGGRR